VPPTVGSSSDVVEVIMTVVEVDVLDVEVVVVVGG
jgi:hypothetical protein